MRMADWTQEDTEVPGDNTHLWEESWDDDDTSEEFSAQLKWATFEMTGLGMELIFCPERSSRRSRRARNADERTQCARSYRSSWGHQRSL
jgi:hypothetical protein